MKPFKKTITLAILTTTLLACNWLGRGEEGLGKGEKPAKAEKTEETYAEQERIEALEWATRERNKLDNQLLKQGDKKAGGDEQEPQRGKIKLYNIPLEDELQEYTFKLCQEYGLDYELTLALMDQESSYRSHVISPTNDYGLMQINTANHERLREELGISDFLDPKENILAGISMMADLFKEYEEPHKVLMAYNHGEAGAKKHWDKGTYTTKYSWSVMAKAEALEERREEECKK